MREEEKFGILLDLDGTEYTEENGYWYRIQAWKIEPNEFILHGIRYNLTLHDNHNQRILGYDNSHAVKVLKRDMKEYGNVLYIYDHKHINKKDPGRPYHFKDAAQLLEDFFKEVDKCISESNKGKI